MSFDGWEEVALAELGTTQTGSTPKKANKDHYGSHIPFVKPADFLADGRLESGKDGLSKIGLESAREIPPFSVLMVCIGATIGKAGFNEVPITTNQQINAFIPGNRVYHKFVYYTFISKAFQRAVNHGSGQATLPIINKTKWSAIKIAVPPKAEQKRIVSILDEAFSAIAKAKENAEKNLLSARELFESYLNRVFTQQGPGWQETNFSEICSIESSLVDPREPEYIDLLHIGAGNMVSQSDELENVMTAREEGLISGKHDFDTSMVLYSKIRPYLMKVSRPKFAGLCSADVYPLKPKDKVLDRDFLFYTLLSKTFTDYAIAGSARAGMPKVNRKHLFAYELSIPSVSEQKRIANAIDDVAASARSLETIYTQKLANLDELKQSLLQKAFTGGLTSATFDEVPV